MKYALALTIFLIPTLFFAQSFEISPIYGYQFGGKINYGYEEIKFTDSDNYGISGTYVLPNGIGVGFEYLRQSTTFTHVYRGLELGHGNVNNDWYQLVGTKNILNKGKLVPYAGLGAGAANFNPDDMTGYSAELKFALTVQGGVKIFLSEHIGIKLHAHMFVPIQWAGFGFYAGSGGSGSGISAGSSFIQGDIGGGLVFRL